MKVKLLKDVASPWGTAPAGGTLNIPEEIAEVWAADGVCLREGDAPPAPPSASELNQDTWPPITPAARRVLEQSGFETLAKLREATDDELLALKGIAEKTLWTIRAHFDGTLPGGDDGEDEDGKQEGDGAS